jgi:hypothetical protein
LFEIRSLLSTMSLSLGVTLSLLMCILYLMYCSEIIKNSYPTPLFRNDVDV